MKVALISDVHLEFGDCFFENKENAEVLILGGDILIGQDLHDFKPDDPGLNLQVLSHRQNAVKSYREFLQRCSDSFEHVIYIAGNHEFYNGKWPLGIDYLREEISNYDNIYFLENETKEIDGITFIGSTLWTDMNKGDPTTMLTVAGLMNDFRIIRNSDHDFTKLRPQHVLSQHLKSLNYIKDVVENDPSKTYVVVGHHAPTKLSVKPKYEKDHFMNGAYSSDLSEFIMDHPQIKLWTHGHTHDKFDYLVGNTRVVCNPRGYVGYEVNTEIAELVYIDV